MTNEAAFVFTVIAIAAVLMASNRVRFDIVALLVVMALMLSGVLSIGEALAGFGSSVVALVAGLLVIGEMLARTGVARGRRLDSEKGWQQRDTLTDPDHARRRIAGRSDEFDRDRCHLYSHRIAHRR